MPRWLKFSCGLPALLVATVVLVSGCGRDPAIEKFMQNRKAYESAVAWLNTQRGDTGWRDLPSSYRELSKSNSVLAMGEPGNRIYLFDIEEGNDWVRYVGYTEQVRRDLGKSINGPSDAWWTEKFLDDHWQISGAMP